VDDVSYATITNLPQLIPTVKYIIYILFTK